MDVNESDEVILFQPLDKDSEAIIDRFNLIAEAVFQTVSNIPDRLLTVTL
jgi:hypothetical protein